MILIQDRQIKKMFILYHRLSILSTAIFFFLIIFLPGKSWGANIYIDPTYNGTELGTFENPYNSWSDIVSFSASNDYRQKCGTTYTGPVNIYQSGTYSNHIILGAYFDNSGSPAHEDKNPRFGQLCGNGKQKPVIRNATSGRTGNAIWIKGGQYIDVDSLKLTTSQHGVKINGNYNKVQYCYIFHTQFGVRTGPDKGSNNTIEYNYVDLDENGDESGNTVNCFSFHSDCNNNVLQYNRCTGYDHAGVFMSDSTGNTVQYNYIYGDDIKSSEDNCFDLNPNSNSNIIRHNKCKNAGKGIQFLGASFNELYGNIFICNGEKYPKIGQGCVQLDPGGSNDVRNNLVYNNTIYDVDNLYDQKGILLTTFGSDDFGSNISGNRFINNAILKIKGYCIKVGDNSGTIGTNYFHNNACYDYTPNQFARIEFKQYSNAALFNARGDSSGNRNNDLGLKNPIIDQLWPESAGSDVVGTGYNLGFKYNKILDPNKTNFVGSPPKVKTINQPTNWYIGAFALPQETLVPPLDLEIIHE